MRSRAQDPPALDDSRPDPGVEHPRAASPSPAASLSSLSSSSVQSRSQAETEDAASNGAPSRSPSPNVAALASSAPPSLISTTSAPPTIVISPPPSTAASLHLPPSSPDGSSNRYSRRENNKVFVPEEPRGVRSRKSIDESSESRAWSSNSPSNVGSPQRRLSPTKGSFGKQDHNREMVSRSRTRRSQSPWSCSLLTLFVTLVAAALGVLIMRSFLNRLFDFDPKGCGMSYMRPAFAKFSDFDTEHTRFATKYSLYLYREGGIDQDTKVKGVPVLFVPGNAGSYKQVRPLAAQAAVHFQEHLQDSPEALKNGKRPLDFFSVDLNEDITAFHGQTMLDQAEYMNEAVQYILSLYHNPNRALRDPDLPDPSSVIIVGHSMGGVVARTMLTMPNYQANTVNTILTLAAPHARAPVSFDSDIIRTYDHINDYWRKSYSEKWANNNPLWHVTLVSISGGGLDTIVPSDYATLASIVPPTHGFTVFTSTIPKVWTSMDHLAITWCDQLRKSIVPALYDVIDVSRSTQTRPRAERMSVFKKAFLTGMESIAEKSLPHQEPKSLLALEDESNKMLSQGDKLVIRGFEGAPKPKAYILPIPPADSRDQKRFTLLTDRKISAPNTDVEVMFCSVFHPNVGSASSVFAMDIQTTGNSSGSTRLACKDAGNDVTQLPASTHESKHPFDQKEPFSYLQYSLEQLGEHQFVAVVDRGFQPRPGWLVAEFSAVSESDVVINDSLRTLLVSGTTLSFAPKRPMMNSIQIPSVQSSLLTYRLSISRPSCLEGWETFSPLLRQYISEPYESKYFVNFKTADIAMHGVAPYLPQPLRQSSSDRGLTLQIWSDPLCKGGMDITLKIDAIGSLGKLWMRYRTVFAAFPLLVVALVLRKQFKIYDQTGVFISFAEATDHCIRTSVPMLVLALTLFAMSTSKQSTQQSSSAMQDMLGLKANVTTSLLDFSKNDLLLGSGDPFFWFLLPLFALLSVGICIAVNYAILTIIHLISITCTRISRFFSNPADPPRNNHNVFVVSSLQKRIITTGILLLFVATLIPYQFVFIVLCLVQMATCVRALGLARETNANANVNFFNYAYSILLLMLWILPINVPTLIVWVHNLAVHWLTPFSSHHNILSIMPFVFVVEMLSTGKMVPRVMSWFIAQATSVLLFAIACGAAIYGVSYAYLLHSWVNLVFGWLTILHMSSSDRVDWKAIRGSLGIAEGQPAVVPGERVRRGADIKKRP